MALWNKCLSDTEIATLFEEETTGSGVYLNSNGTWSEATAIYQKSGTSWNQITQSELLEILEAGTKLIKG